MKSLTSFSKSPNSNFDLCRTTRGSRRDRSDMNLLPRHAQKLFINPRQIPLDRDKRMNRKKLRSFAIFAKPCIGRDRGTSLVFPAAIFLTVAICRVLFGK